MDFEKFERVPDIRTMERFYAVDSVPDGRPYTWYMFVMSADGVGSFMDSTHPDPGIGLSGPGIALAHLKNRPEARGAATDYRLLQFGWAAADAILAGSGIIRAEPGLEYSVTDSDLVEYVKKKGEPIRAFLTGRGLDAQTLSYPVFNSDKYRTIIFTSERGSDVTTKASRELDRNPLEHTELEVLGKKRVDVADVARVLHKKYDVNLLDLQGGPSVAGQWFEDEAFGRGLVDEYRLTISPVIAGYMNRDDMQRPSPVRTSFDPKNPPTMDLANLGLHGSHLFTRYKLKYYQNGD